MKLRTTLLLFNAWAAAVSAPLPGQTHATGRPESVVRALAVYEWTGDQGKPTASRVMPVSLFIEKDLHDAGVYMANPVPLALDVGNLFELQGAGVGEGLLELVYSRHVTESGPQDSEDIDGWVGYGTVKLTPKAAAAPTTLKQTGAAPKIVASGGKGPHFGSTPPPAAPDTQEETKRAPIDHSGGTRGTVSTAGSDSSESKEDAERPTLRRRTPVEQKQDAKKRDQASVAGVGSLNDDPDRPTLQRGRPAGLMDQVPPLMGLPADMHQAVAVSDARDRDEHDFSRAWESPDERTQVLAAMEQVARDRLAAYARAATVAQPSAPVQPSSPTQPGSWAAARPRGPRRPSAPSPSALAAALAEERLAGYTLSYGGAATYVYTASVPGPDKSTQYVTLVAQQENGGPLRQAFTSVTDSAHLDRTAQYRLVDAVDAEASNRASLLFELRAQSTRQFALYRVIDAKAEQTFATGTIPVEK